jgi:hypothetical protein
MQPRSRGLANGFSPRGLKAGTGKPPGRGLVECLAFDPRPEGLGYGKGQQSNFASASGAEIPGVCGKREQNSRYDGHNGIIRLNGLDRRLMNHAG